MPRESDDVKLRKWVGVGSCGHARKSGQRVSASRNAGNAEGVERAILRGEPVGGVPSPRENVTTPDEGSPAALQALIVVGRALCPPSSAIKKLAGVKPAPQATPFDHGRVHPERSRAVEIFILRRIDKRSPVWNMLSPSRPAPNGPAAKQPRGRPIEAGFLHVHSRPHRLSSAVPLAVCERSRAVFVPVLRFPP
jgi:hypothetical protein